MNKVYVKTINDVVDDIWKAVDGVIGVDGSTNRPAKLASRVVIKNPIPLFPEYLSFDLKRGIFANVVDGL